MKNFYPLNIRRRIAADTADERVSDVTCMPRFFSMRDLERFRFENRSGGRGRNDRAQALGKIVFFRARAAFF